MGIDSTTTLTRRANHTPARLRLKEERKRIIRALDTKYHAIDDHERVLRRFVLIRFVEMLSSLPGFKRSFFFRFFLSKWCIFAPFPEIIYGAFNGKCEKRSWLAIAPIWSPVASPICPRLVYLARPRLPATITATLTLFRRPTPPWDLP